MGRIDIVRTELTVDPEGRGYSGMNDVAAASDLNTVYRTSNKSSLTGSEVMNAIDKTEFNALSDADKQLVWDILHLGTVNPFGLEADLLTDIFEVGSTTITSLLTLRKNNISRGVELGVGVVRAGHIQEARR